MGAKTVDSIKFLAWATCGSHDDLLYSQFMGSRWLTVIELYCTPQTMELATFIYTHDPISRVGFFPHIGRQE